MRHAIGLINFPSEESVFPADEEGRIRFSTLNFHAKGYFNLIAPLFDEFGRRDAKATIMTINIQFVLTGKDLPIAQDKLKILRSELNAYPTMWNSLLGTYQKPGCSPIDINPVLFRSRAYGILNLLENLILTAIRSGKSVIYGNGVCYSRIVGEELPPGVKVYS